MKNIQERSTRRKLAGGGLLICVLAVALYLAFFLIGDWAKILKAVSLLDRNIWIFVLLLSGVNYLLRFLRWQRVIGRLEILRLPWVGHFACYVAGFAFTATPGKAGELTRSFLLSRRGVSLEASFSAFFFERILDFFAIVLLSLFAILNFPNLQWIVLGGLAFFLFVPVLFRPRGRLWGWMLEFLKGKVKNGTDAIENAYHLLNSRLGFYGLILGLIAWGLEGFGLHLILHGMGVEIPLILTIGIYGLAVLAGAVSFIPGGLGGTEAVMVGCLVATGVSLSMAVAATLVCRIATLWFAIALGLFILPIVAFRR